MQTNQIRLLLLSIVMIIAYCYFSCSFTTNGTKSNSLLIDSINSELLKSKNRSLSKNKRIEYVNNALRLIGQISNDSTKIEFMLNSSFSLYKIGDSTKFSHTINNTLQLANSLENTAWYKARANRYLGYFYDKKGFKELAYKFFYNSSILYSNIDKVRSAEMLRRLASIERDLHQYNNAENHLAEAIKILKVSNNFDKLHSYYNLYGIIKTDTKEFNKSLEYYLEAKKSLSTSQSSDSLSSSSIHNNIGRALMKLGRHEESLAAFESAIYYSKLKERDEKFYYRLKDNLNYVRYKLGGQYHSVSKNNELYTSKKIIKDYSGMIMNRFYYSEIQVEIGYLKNAIDALENALSLSRDIGNKYLELKCLEEIIKIGGDNIETYSISYISLKSELEIHERKIRNRLGMIRMKTDDYKKKNKELERELILLIIIVLIVAICVSFIIYFKRQKLRLEKISKEKEKKEIVLSLIAKNRLEVVKAIKGANTRISRELHDEVLSRLFAARYSLEILNNKDDDKSIKYREDNLLELKSLERDIRNISHELKRKFDSDFQKAITELLEDVLKFRSSIHYSINDNFEKWFIINDTQKVALYRIIQESLTNIIKHSKANSIIVTFDKKSNKLIMSISDNGIGFIIKKSNGIGMQNIHERVYEMGADIEIESKINIGTRIIVSLPLSIL